MKSEIILIDMTTRRPSNTSKSPVYRKRRARKSMWKLAKWPLCIGLVAVCALSACQSGLRTDADADDHFKTETTMEVEEWIPTSMPTPEATPEVPLYEDLGVCRVTAYCSCEKCCGKWALNRPNGIVYGAEGTELIAGVSCASPLPFGTILEIEGLGQYVVQDRIAQWVLDEHGDNCVDIYFDSHEEARAFALQYLNVKVVIQ